MARLDRPKDIGIMLVRPFIHRLGLIGDVHGARPELERALEHFTRVGVDAVAAVGDFVDGPPFGPSDFDGCLDLIRREHILSVRGNHDRWALGGHFRLGPGMVTRAQLKPENVTFLGSLPRTLSFDTPLGEALLCHGVGTDDMTFLDADTPLLEALRMPAFARLIRSGFRFVLCGHTHNHMVRHFGQLTVVNGGALTQAELPGFTLIDFEAARVEFHAFTRAEVVTSSLNSPAV
jgi:predicted phosphodiesterase